MGATGGMIALRRSSTPDPILGHVRRKIHQV